MSHTCSSALIRCMDFRLTKAFNNWMEKNNIMNDCDIISVAGVVKNIAEDKDSEASKYILEQISLSKKLHDIKTLYIIHHTDCGAYGGHDAFEGLEDETRQHHADMNTTKNIIEENISDLEVKIVLADMETDEKINFIEF
jgi:carbonic anhydrase